MAVQPAANAEQRVPLSRDRVLRTAVEIADRGGVGALTMRSLAAELGVEAMSLYYHVANKGEILDGIVEVVIGEINDAVRDLDPGSAADWKRAVRARILAARQVLLRHPWAPSVIETRTTMSHGVIRYYDDLLGLLHRGGLSYDLAHHALHALGSRALGFTQEAFDPDTDDGGEEAIAVLEQMADEFPNLVAMLAGVTHDPASTLGWCDDQFEFEFGLDLILDGLERLAAS